MSRTWILVGAIHGFCAVAMGAFAAHALSSRLEPKALSVFQTASHYQMVHGLALLALGLFSAQSASNLTTWAGGCFSIGIFLFSFSLYLLALTDIRWLGAITPLGGLSLLAGWIFFAISAKSGS